MTRGTEPSAGTALPGLERTIELPDMVAYAGATWDWHRLHYDSDYLRAKQVPAPVVDGQVLGALLAEQVQDWLGPSWRLTRLHFRFRAMVFAGDTVRCVGEVVEAAERRMVVAQRVLVGDRVAVEPAGAEVERR